MLEHSCCKIESLEENLQAFFFFVNAWLKCCKYLTRWQLFINTLMNNEIIILLRQLHTTKRFWWVIGSTDT